MNIAHVALRAAGDDQQKAAPLGLFVLLLLGLACYFLFKSMSRHLKRVREDFPHGSSPAMTPPAASRSASTVRPAGDEPGPADPDLNGAGGADDGEQRPH